MAASETMVRMGELAVSSVPGHVLVSLGLGSCIGLALLDRRMGIAGLAHIVLPQSQGHANDNPRKFADLAVPELIAQLTDLGARKVRLEAVLVGGASMFAVSAASLEVGQRNEEAVRDLLKSLRIPVIAAATGGSKGRTIRVDVETAGVTVREAGGKDSELLAGTQVLEAVAA
jgi:chemotaxis protein CheD